MMIRAFMTLINISWIVLAIAGLALSAIGYRQGRMKAAFVLFMLYFAASLYAQTLSRPVMRWLTSRRAYEITQEQLEQYAKMEEEIQAVYMRYPMVEPGVAVRYINFPFGQALLVAGVWMIVKKKEES